jgi:dTDP-4-amino-4,6-dideoxygalactose transaminase
MKIIVDKYLHSSPNDLKNIKIALDEKKLSGTSEYITNYEEKLAEYFKIKFVVAQSSGSAALHSALYALNVKPGDEVVLPAISPLPTALPIITAGAIPIFVDIKPDTFGFDITDLKKKLTKKTKAAILVPLWGYPIDYTETIKVLKKYNVPLIEDCAQSHGTLIDGMQTGSFGTVGCWSTHDRKLLSTGEGGFIATKDKKISDKIRQFSQLGYMNNIDYGVNYKLSSVQAALGVSRLPDIEMHVEKRTANARLLEKGLIDTEIVPLPILENSRPNYYGFVIKLPFSKEKNKKFINMLDERGIPSDMLQYKYKPLYKRELFKKYYKDKCPVTENLIDSITTLPVHPGIKKSEISYMIKQIKEILKEL